MRWTLWEYRIESFARWIASKCRTECERNATEECGKYLWIFRHQLPVVICIAWMFESNRFCDIGWNLSNACSNRFNIGSNWCFHQMGRRYVGISAILVKSTLGGKLIDSKAEYLLMMAIESIKNDYTLFPIMESAQRCQSIGSDVDQLNLWCPFTLTLAHSYIQTNINKTKQSKENEENEENEKNEVNVNNMKYVSKFHFAPK